jgi:pimeloyl-ACP methyl ester carboxylesterase
VSEVTREFVALPTGERAGWGSHRCQGILHARAGADTPPTAFIATHYNVDFSEHYLAEPLARRGYGFLGWNTRFRGAEGYFQLEPALADIGVGVSWLREQRFGQVVLLGNSGGGSLMAAYQATAQESGGALPAADLYVSLAAHPGRPQILTTWLDPSVTDETDPLSVDPALDMYNPDNGPPYSPEFVERYRAAQVERNRTITAWALAERERLRATGARDRVFTLQRTWADLRFTDPALDPSDRPTPSCYAGDPQRANRGVLGIGVMNTLRTWLEMWSLEHSRCGGEEHLQKIALPALVIQATMDTGVFPADARAITEALASEDKRLIELPGDHYFRGPDGARERLADEIAAWCENHAGGTLRAAPTNASGPAAAADSRSAEPIG